MSKKVIISITGFLLFFNIVCWGEVFVLAQPRYLEVSFLNVGQGDSAFIQTPEGHQIIIDGGPNAVLLEKLAERMPFWDKTIDLVILTHPDKDHLTGLLDVLQKYKVDYFLWTGVIKNDAENKKLAEILDKVQKDPRSNPQNFLLASLDSFNGTKVIIGDANKKIKAGNVLFDIFYPLENLAGQELKKINESSVVSRLIYGSSSFLFTGDIGFAVEKNIVGSGLNLQSNVLKVAHHGSKYSTSDLWLKNVSPQYAVIEVGKNSYGHPTPEVLQRLEKSGIKVLRTDINGDIEFVSDGNTIKLINK